MNDEWFYYRVRWDEGVVQFKSGQPLANEKAIKDYAFDFEYISSSAYDFVTEAEEITQSEYKRATGV